jgi:hypothetical protein
MEGDYIVNGSSVPQITDAYATARRLIARAVPLERDDVVDAAKRRGHRSSCVEMAIHEYELSHDALDLASVGYVEAGLNLGMALMFQLLRDPQKGRA